MKNFIQVGHVVPVAAPYAVVSGQGALVGAMFGVAGIDAASGGPLELHVVGVFELDKAASQAWTQGANVYWDNAARRCTTVVGSNTLIGKATAAVPGTAGAVLGPVRLNG